MDKAKFNQWYKDQLERCARAKSILDRKIYYRVLGREFGCEHANELKIKDLKKFLGRLRQEYLQKERRENYAKKT